MDQIKIREGRSEVLVYTDKHFPDELSLLQETIRILRVEVMRLETDPNRHIGR